MSINERDYYYDPKQFRNGNNPRYDLHSGWGKKKSNGGMLFVLGVCIAMIFWLFSNQIFDYLATWIPSKRISTADTRPSIPVAPTAPIVQFPPITPPHAVIPEEPFPESGSTIQYQQARGAKARFTVIPDSRSAENCVIKLETWNGGIPVLELFLKGNQPAITQDVPLGDYRVKYACGEKWYGRNEMFGRGTRVSIGLTPMQFWQAGNQIMGNTITLQKVADGNFRTNDSYFNKF
jgi:hypothetical protein